MAPAYKLIYFNVPGLGECIRYLLTFGGIEFEDVRIEHENWPALKPSTPFGQLPVLERNGAKVGQSIAISRYIAKLVDLAGTNDFEDLEIDAIVDTLADIRQKIYPAHLEKDEEKKAALRKTALEETIPYYFTRLEAIAKKNKGHLALGRLTWADFYFTCIVSVYNNLLGGGDAMEEILRKHISLQVLKDKVEDLPAIRKWAQAH